MTAAEFRACLAAIRATPAVAGRLLGTASRQSPYHYANGKTPVPRTAERLLRLVQRLGLTAQQAIELIEG